jgi:hypothetical protein
MRIDGMWTFADLAEEWEREWHLCGSTWIDGGVIEWSEKVVDPVHDQARWVCSGGFALDRLDFMWAHELLQTTSLRFKDDICAAARWRPTLDDLKL